MTDALTVIEAARRHAHLSERDLWWRFVAVGGTLSPVRLHRALSGAEDLSAREHTRLAAALNDRFVELGDESWLLYDEEEE